MAQRFDKKQNVKKNNAFTALHNLYSDREISNMMNRFGYNDDIMLVMNGNQERLKERFPQTWNNISSCTRKADNRTPMQYAKDSDKSSPSCALYYLRYPGPSYTLPLLPKPVCRSGTYPPPPDTAVPPHSRRGRYRFSAP